MNKISAVLAAVFVGLMLTAGLSGCISREKEKPAIPPPPVSLPGAFEILENASFLKYEDFYDPPAKTNNIPFYNLAPRALTCYGSHVNTFFPFNKDERYLGLNAVNYNYNRAPVTSCGFPLAATGIKVEGLETPCIPGDFSKTDPNYKVEYLPYAVHQQYSKLGFDFDVWTTFIGGDYRDTFYVHVDVKNNGSDIASAPSVAPFIKGQTVDAPESGGTTSNGAVSLSFFFTACEGTFPAALVEQVPHTMNILIRPLFDVGDSAVSQESGQGSTSYWVAGRYTPLEPGQSSNFSYLVFLDVDDAIGTPPQPVSFEWKDVEKSARGWYNASFSNVPLPPANLTEKQKQYYYGAIWNLRHNEYYPEGKLTRQIIRPAVSYYDAIWNWDTPFHVFALRETAPDVAKEQILQLCELQDKDPVNYGRIRCAYGAAWDEEQAQPPLLSWSAVYLYDKVQDLEFVKQVYQPLVDFHNWWKNNRDINMNGIYEYQTCWETGWDDSPRWAAMSPVIGDLIGLGVIMRAEAIDLNCLMHIDTVSLAKMAEIIGKNDDAKSLREEAEALAQRINEKMWNEELGLYMDIDGVTGQMSGVKSPASFYPMLAGICPKDRAKRMVEEHLLNPKEFWTPLPVPVVSADDPNYNPNNYWRGPVWVNINFIVITALRNYGYNEIANDMKAKTIDAITNSTNFMEYYNSQTGKGVGAPNFGWSAALYIELALGRENDFKNIYKELFEIKE